MTNRQLKKAREEFLDEMVAFYSVDPVNRRAIKTENEIVTQCYYRDPEDPSKKCSIGRYIPDEKYSREMEQKVVNNLLLAYPDALPQEVKDLRISFLREIQELHDSCSWGEGKFWNDIGLTEAGRIKLEIIKLEYINLLPDDDNEVQGQDTFQEKTDQ